MLRPITITDNGSDSSINVNRNLMDAKKLIEEVLLDLGNNKTLTEVSSKIQIIVRLLGDEELKAWYNCEFVKGYQDEKLPDYRMAMAAEIKAYYFVPH